MFSIAAYPLCFLFKIAGGTAVIAGCLVKFGSGFLDTEVTTLFNKITVNNVPLGTLADVVAYMMIISGALLMIIAILGICGAWKEVTGCLWAVSNIIPETNMRKQ